MATFNVKTPMKVRFKDMTEAAKYGCDALVEEFSAGSHVVPDELMDHPYIKAHHKESRKPKMGTAGRMLEPKKAPEPKVVETGAGDGGSKEAPKPLDDMTYPELKAEFERVKGEAPPANISKAKLLEALAG